MIGNEHRLCALFQFSTGYYPVMVHIIFTQNLVKFWLVTPALKYVVRVSQGDTSYIYICVALIFLE